MILDSIAVSLFVDWSSLSNTESEANPNNNLMMRRAGLSWWFWLFTNCRGIKRSWVLMLVLSANVFFFFTISSALYYILFTWRTHYRGPLIAAPYDQNVGGTISFQCFLMVSLYFHITTTQHRKRDRTRNRFFCKLGSLTKWSSLFWKHHFHRRGN